MILAGGLLRLYWDSGPPVEPPVPPPSDDLPLGVENTARPNVRMRWGVQERHSATRAEVDEQDAVPLPLPLAPHLAAARPVAAALGLRLRQSSASPLVAHASGRAQAAGAQAAALLRALPRAAQGAPLARAALVQPTVEPRQRRQRNARAAGLAMELLGEDVLLPPGADTRQARNRKAIEIALRLLDED